MNNGLELNGDYLPRIPGGATLEQTQNALNDIINRLNDQLQFQQFADDTNKSVQLGKNPNGSVGLQLLDANGKVITSYAKNTDKSIGLKFFDANGVGLALFGQYPDGTTALKVAKKNIEVTTAANDQLIFNSNQNVLKVVKSDVAYVNIGSTDSYKTVTTKVAHNLGYTPVVLGYVDTISNIFPATGRTATPYTMYSSTTTSAGTGFLNNQAYTVIGYFSVSVDNTYVYFNVSTSSVTFYSQLQDAWKFTYYLLQESAN